jgi:hypothetical protein
MVVTAHNLVVAHEKPVVVSDNLLHKLMNLKSWNQKMHIEVMVAPKDEVARNARRGIGQPAAQVNESENLEPEMHIGFPGR